MQASADFLCYLPTDPIDFPDLIPPTIQATFGQINFFMEFD